MSTKIGDYSLSKDRSTIYYHDVAIYKSGSKQLSHNLYTEDGEVCFYDTNTKSIYHVKENEVKQVYNNVSFFQLFTVVNYVICKGRTIDGKTAVLKLIDDTFLQKILVCSKDYTSFFFEKGYCLSEDDFELFLYSHDLDEYCLLSNNGFSDLPTYYSKVYIHYNYAGDRVIFFFDKNNKQLKAQHKNKEIVLYTQKGVIKKRFDGSLIAIYPEPSISYSINNDDH